MKIEITEGTDFISETFSFYFSSDDLTLYLDEYSYKTRPSKRHKFRRQKYYSRLFTRDSNIGEAQVPFTWEIERKALDQIISQLSVKMWSERRR